MGLIQTSTERQSPSSSPLGAPLSLATQRRSLKLLNELDILRAQRLFFEMYPDVDTV